MKNKLLIFVLLTLFTFYSNISNSQTIKLNIQHHIGNPSPIKYDNGFVVDNISSDSTAICGKYINPINNQSVANYTLFNHKTGFIYYSLDFFIDGDEDFTPLSICHNTNNKAYISCYSSNTKKLGEIIKINYNTGAIETNIQLNTIKDKVLPLNIISPNNKEVYLVGFTSEASTSNIGGAKSNFTMKFDDNLNLIWSKERKSAYTSNSYDMLNDVTYFTDSHNNSCLIVTGTMSVKEYTGIPNIYNTVQRPFVSKIDANSGAILWEKTYSDNNITNIGRGVSSIYESQTGVIYTILNSWDYTSFLLKIDPITGNLLSGKSILLGSHNVCYDVLYSRNDQKLYIPSFDKYSNTKHVIVFDSNLDDFVSKYEIFGSNFQNWYHWNGSSGLVDKVNNNTTTYPIDTLSPFIYTYRPLAYDGENLIFSNGIDYQYDKIEITSFNKNIINSICEINNYEFKYDMLGYTDYEITSIKDDNLLISSSEIISERVETSTEILCLNNESNRGFQTDIVNVYPNKVSNDRELFIVTNLDILNSKIYLYGVDGLEQKLTLTKNEIIENSYSIDLSKLNILAGIYTIKIITNESVVTKSIIVE